MSKRPTKNQFAQLLAATQGLLAELESTIRSEYEGTNQYEALMAELDPYRAAIAHAQDALAP